MRYILFISILFISSINSYGQVKTGDRYGGVVKLTTAAAKMNVNGKWNNSDNTGNAAIDSVLNNFATANKTNPGAMTALENAAAEVKSNPAAFINSDGSINKKAFDNLLTQKFAGVARVTVPAQVFVDSNTNKGLR